MPGGGVANAAAATKTQHEQVFRHVSASSIWTRSTVRIVRAASDRQVEGSKPSEPFDLHMGSLPDWGGSAFGSLVGVLAWLVDPEHVRFNRDTD